METRHVVLTETVRNLEKYKDEMNKRANVKPWREFTTIGSLRFDDGNGNDNIRNQ